MKYKERDALVADLRELADLLEERGHKLPIEYPRVSLVSRFYDSEGEPTPKTKMLKAAKNIGKADKRQSYDYELIRKMKNGFVELRFETNRENVCTKRVVGTKQVEKKIWVTIPNEFVDQEVVEWDCSESLLAE
jgi:hypothetical protein